MTELKPFPESEGIVEDHRPAKVLVISFFGFSHAVHHQGYIFNHFSDFGYCWDSFDEEEGYSWEEALGTPPSDGIWVWEGDVATTPYDFYNDESSEFIGNYRPATKEEWKNYIQDHYVFDIPSPEFIAQRNRDWKRNSDLIAARDSFIVRAISLCENTRARPNNEWDRRLREAYNAYKKEEKR